jgi:hypothetical protein
MKALAGRHCDAMTQRTPATADRLLKLMFNRLLSLRPLQLVCEDSPDGVWHWHTLRVLRPRQRCGRGDVQMKQAVCDPFNILHY